MTGPGDEGSATGSHAPTMRPGGRILVDQLLAHGVERAFCVPGESYLAVLDALYDVQDRIQLVVARQEGGAAFMASAHGKLTGRPGVCFVTRGPGATNASVGVHTARQDSTPMVLFVGQVPREHSDREAFQEVDLRAMFRPLAKEVLRIDQPARIPELVARAFHVAVSGRPGPVVVALPEDMLTETASVADARPSPEVRPAPTEDQLDQLGSLLADARRPLVVAGGPGWSDDTVAGLSDFAATHRLPVVTAFRHQDLFDNTSEQYAGTLGLSTVPGVDSYVQESDLLIIVGARLDAMSTRGYALLDVPEGAQRLVHVYPDADELGRVHQPDLPIDATVSTFVPRLAGLKETGDASRADWTSKAHHNYLRSLEITSPAGRIDPRHLVETLQRCAPTDAIITHGAGAYTSWPQRYHRFGHYPSQLAPQSGTMGYGLPAAIAAQLAEPERTVIAFAGDGCLLMTGQELATARRYDLPILIVVADNARYGTIRMHQERQHPGRVIGTDLTNPDFVTYAESFGALAARVETDAEFEDAAQRFLAKRQLALIAVQAPELGAGT